MSYSSGSLVDVFSLHPVYKRYEMPLDTGKAGQRTYTFTVNDEFFDPLSFSMIKKGRVDVKVTLYKQKRSLMMSLELEGYVTMPCVRCLSEVRQPLAHRYNVMIKFTSDGEDAIYKDIDLLLLPEGTTAINMAPEIYDYINISMPSVVVCPDNSCNPEMEQLINEYSPHNKGRDPRWEALLQQISTLEKT